MRILDTILPILLLALFSPITSYSDPTDGATSVPLPRLEGQRITIDGIMDEEVWSDAVLFDGFYQYLPVDGRHEVDSTQVYAWYSPTAIYFGIKAYETHGEVRATLADRDKISNDDYIYIVLDTYNDQRQGFIFGSNPLGQQADGIMRDSEGSRFFSSSNSGSFTQDLSPDFVYTSKGTITDYGYVIEFEIPFKSLRYQSDLTQNWGFNIIRKVQHSGYLSTWTQVLQANASFMAQNGTLQSLTDLRRGLVLDISPEITSTVARAESDSPWDSNVRDPLGVNVRWGVSNNLTLNATVNPDFSQVEADVAQIQFDPRRAVFVPERRPFFLDGIELFQSPTRLIYSRRIANPLSAAKLTGKTGGTNVAYLSAIDNSEVFLSDLAPVYFNALRVRQDLKGQNTLGITYTDKIDGSHWNRVAAVDGRLVFNKIYSLTYQTGFSFTGDPGSTVSAPMWQFRASASGRKYGASFSTSGFHGDFNAESGFITRVGVAQMTFTPRVTWFGEEGSKVEKFTTGITLDGTWDYDRFTRGTGPNDRKLHGNTSYSFRGGWSGGTSVFYESFKYPKELYTDYFVEIQNNGVPVDTVAYTGTDRLINLGFWSFLNTPQLNTFSGNLFIVAGRDDNFFEWASADIYFIDVSLNWNPTDKLRFNLLYNHQQYVRADDKSTVGLRRVPRLKAEYQITPSIFLRLVGQYDSNYVDELRDNSRTDDPILILDRDTGIFERTTETRANRFRVDWLFSYRPTPGTVLFLGYGSSLQEPQSFRFRNLRRFNDGFFAKFSYLFRV
ncbi:MAG: carbohydrate binding family 9 domain-containing protein [Rhodothermaceae bacterium]|nr:carbohydrate binding family 9 domain-containing protein [Rhodothermaceae bacterium]